MQISEKRLAANRANSLKSTGPKTPTGRRNSSRNAIKHGILASAVLIEGESTRRFNELVQSFHDEYQLEGPSARALIDKLAESQWVLLRIWTVQSAVISHEMQRLADSGTGQSPAIRAMLAMRSLSENSRYSELLSRYEHRYDMQHHRAMQALNRMKEEKLAGTKQSHQSEENKAPCQEPKATITH
jgi:hypothetical protein